MRRLWNYIKSFFIKEKKGFEWTGFIKPQNQSGTMTKVEFFDAETFQEKFTRAEKLDDLLK